MRNTLIVIDDVWQESELDLDASLIASKKEFPEGIPALVEYVKVRGFKPGI